MGWLVGDDCNETRCVEFRKGNGRKNKERDSGVCFSKEVMVLAAAACIIASSIC